MALRKSRIPGKYPCDYSLTRSPPDYRRPDHCRLWGPQHLHHARLPHHHEFKIPHRGRTNHRLQPVGHGRHWSHARRTRQDEGMGCHSDDRQRLAHLVPLPAFRARHRVTDHPLLHPESCQKLRLQLGRGSM